MSTHTVGLEEFRGEFYIEVEIEFDVQPDEPPCTYSNGNRYPGCSAQLDVTGVRVLRLTGETVDFSREELVNILHPSYISSLDKDAHQRVLDEIDNGS